MVDKVKNTERESAQGGGRTRTLVRTSISCSEIRTESKAPELSVKGRGAKVEMTGQRAGGPEMTAVPRGGPGLLLVRKSAPEWERFQFKTNKNFHTVKTIQERTDDVIL